VHETEVGEDGIGHVLVEERSRAKEIECNSVWSVCTFC